MSIFIDYQNKKGRKCLPLRCVWYAFLLFFFNLCTSLVPSCTQPESPSSGSSRISLPSFMKSSRSQPEDISEAEVKCYSLPLLPLFYCPNHPAIILNKSNATNTTNNTFATDDFPTNNHLPCKDKPFFGERSFGFVLLFS